MDQISFVGNVAKLERADEHLKALTDEIGGFTDSDPYTYALQVDPDAGHHSVRITIERPLPIRLEIICGDFVHCLRSAFDYIVCAVVPTFTRSTQFRL